MADIEIKPLSTNDIVSPTIEVAEVNITNEIGIESDKVVNPKGEATFTKEVVETPPAVAEEAYVDEGIDLEAIDVEHIYENKKVLPQGSLVEDADVPQDIKECFFGKSPFKLEEEKDKVEDVFDIIDTFKALGESRDVYLPESNVVVRIMEFENDLFLPEVLPVIIDDDEVQQGIVPEISHDAIFIRKIFDNMRIVCKDSKTLTSFDYEKLSNLDMNILVLAAARLILLSDPDITDKNNITMDTTCPNCGRAQKVTVNLEELFKAQYTKEHLKYARENFNISDTFEANFKRSRHEKSKSRGAKYSKDGKRAIFVAMCDPSYIEFIQKEANALRYLISEYEKVPVVENVIRTVDYKAKSLKMKFYKLVEVIMSSESRDSYQNKISMDVQIMNIIMYVKSILGKDLEANKYTSQYDTVDTPMETLFKLVKALPRELKDKISKIVEDFQSHAIKYTLNYKYECNNPKCGKENTVELTARSMVFLILQNLSKQAEEDTTQD